tara:strand:+ start:6115 stop:6666 length:552 start_codon:yes stop_codon:yes gene_type:complete
MKCIDGKERSGNYSTYGGSGHYGIQGWSKQQELGLDKRGFVALRHKESGDILIPNMKTAWAEGITHKWWDSKDNKVREAGGWAWNMAGSNKAGSTFFNACLKEHFRSKPTDYELILFQLKENEMLGYYHTYQNDIGYGGPCPMTRKQVDKIEKVVVISTEFCGTIKDKVVAKDAISVGIVKEV